LIVVPKPLPAAPLVVRRMYLIAVPRPLPLLLGRGAGAARCASHVLDRGTQAVASFT
jgi:hypothetical protein